MEFRYKLAPDTRICGGAYGSDLAFLTLNTGFTDGHKVVLKFDLTQGEALAEQIARAITEMKDDAEAEARRAEMRSVA